MKQTQRYTCSIEAPVTRPASVQFPASGFSKMNVGTAVISCCPASLPTALLSALHRWHRLAEGDEMFAVFILRSAYSSLVSRSTFRISRFSARSSESFSICGATIWQGPHLRAASLIQPPQQRQLVPCCSEVKQCRFVRAGEVRHASILRTDSNRCHRADGGAPRSTESGGSGTE